MNLQSHFAKIARRWPLWLGAVSLLAFAGCTEAPKVEDPISCSGEAILVKGDSGECEWKSTCDVANEEICAEDFTCDALPPEACAIDSRCEGVTVTACPVCLPEYGCGAEECSTSTSCEDIRPPSGCDELNEAMCVGSAECEAVYGWADGSTADKREPSDGDAPVFMEWQYLGCEAPGDDDPCADFGADVCDQKPGCQSQWGSPPCDCAGSEEGANCACPDIAEYQGCEEVPDYCESKSDPYSCEDTKGCRWDESASSGGATEPACPPCGPGEDCACAAPAPLPEGACVRDGGVSPQNCGDLYDPNSCWSKGCEWIGGGTDEFPRPDCGCDGPGCEECTEPAEPGYCTEPTTKPGEECYDAYDPNSCYSMPGCEWYGEPAPEPEPCDCAPGENCACAEPVPAGWCGPTDPDEGCDKSLGRDVCLSNPECDWYQTDCKCEPGGPCDDCDYYEFCGYKKQGPVESCYDYELRWGCEDAPGCRWVEDGTEPEPCVCEPGEECLCPDPGEGFGYCTPDKVSPDTCESAIDPWTCWDIPGCDWYKDPNGGAPAPPPPCTCEPNDPDCACDARPACFGTEQWGQDGVCYDEWGNATSKDCCSMTQPGHCGAADGPTPPPEPVDECADRDLDQCEGDGACELYTRDGFAPAPAECVVACDTIGEEWTCSENEHCTWTYSDCNCQPGEPCNCLVAAGVCESNTGSAP